MKTLCCLSVLLSLLTLTTMVRVQWASDADIPPGAMLDRAPSGQGGLETRAPHDLLVITDPATGTALYRWHADGTEVLAPGVTRERVRLWLWQVRCAAATQCA